MEKIEWVIIIVILQSKERLIAERVVAVSVFLHFPLSKVQLTGLF